MRALLIRVDDFLDGTRQRERRRGTTSAAAAAIVLAVVVGVSRQPQPETYAAPAPAPAVSPIPAASVQPIPVATSTQSPARATISPAKMSFAPLTAGSTSSAQLLVLRNDGDEPLTIRGVAVHGAGFQMANRCGDTLGGHESCNVAVVFAPASEGDHAGSVVVDTSAAAIDVPLRATARSIPPVRLASIDFGRHASDAPVAPQRVQFVNGSASAIEIGAVSMEPANPFAIVSNGCRGRVAPGGRCDVMISFAPRAGAAQSELRITAAEGRLIARGSVSGSGFVREPEIVHLDIQPRALHFLSPVMSNGRGGVTPPQRVTLTNPSAVPVVIRSVRLVGRDRSFNVDAKQCENMTLPPRGGRCSIVIGAMLSNLNLDAAKLLVEHTGASEPDAIGTSAAPR